MPADLPADHIVNLEEGLRNYDIPLTGADHLVLRLTQQKVPIGLIRFLLFPAERQLKIQTILDAHCAKVGPTGRNTLDNWDHYEFPHNGQTYAIRLGYYVDLIRVIRFEPVP